MWTSENLLRAFYELYLLNFQFSFKTYIFCTISEFHLNRKYVLSNIQCNVICNVCWKTHFQWIKKKFFSFVDLSILSTVHHIIQTCMPKCLCLRNRRILKSRNEKIESKMSSHSIYAAITNLEIEENTILHFASHKLYHISMKRIVQNKKKQNVSWRQ